MAQTKNLRIAPQLVRFVDIKPFETVEMYTNKQYRVSLKTALNAKYYLN